MKPGGKVKVKFLGEHEFETGTLVELDPKYKLVVIETDRGGEMSGNYEKIVEAK